MAGFIFWLGHWVDVVAHRTARRRSSWSMSDGTDLPAYSFRSRLGCIRIEISSAYDP
jgi:hypothetical protein